MVLDSEAFDVLPADIHHEIDVGGEILGSSIMGDRLNEAIVDAKGGADQVLAIADDAAGNDRDVFPESGIKVAQLALDANERRTSIRGILGI